MTGDLIDIVTHLGIAALAGGLIGFERSYHGRPAGFGPRYSCLHGFESASYAGNNLSEAMVSTSNT